MTNLYNNAQFFGPLVESYISQLLPTPQTTHFRIPIDIELNLYNLHKTADPSNVDFEFFEGSVMWKDNEPIPFAFNDECFYGLVLVEQNPRFFGMVNNEGYVLTEVPVDDPVLLETYVQLIDNAGFFQTNEQTGAVTFAECPNVWKSIKPYKELHSPLPLKPLPLERNADGSAKRDLNGDFIYKDSRDYGSRVRIYEPLDACGNAIPEWDDEMWTRHCYGQLNEGPFVHIVEKVIAILKADDGTRDKVAGWKFPSCYYYEFALTEHEMEECNTKSKGMPF